MRREEGGSEGKKGKGEEEQAEKESRGRQATKQ